MIKSMFGSFYLPGLGAGGARLEPGAFQFLQVCSQEVPSKSLGVQNMSE